MRLPEPCLGADHPANRLRELYAGLDALQARPDCDSRLRALMRFLLAALARYDAEACVGMTLDAALGLRRVSGPAQWWNTERTAHRDRALREIAARHYQAMNPTAATEAILRDVALLNRQADPPAGTATADVARAMRYGTIPGPRKLRDILSAEINACI